MPLVSVIVPCYNEETTIGQLLDGVYAQTFPLADMEVIIADGYSEDNTRQVITTYQAAHPDLVLRLVDNPKRNIPAGLNRAIQAAQGKYLVRLDAHSKPYPDYVRLCVADLEAGCGENVGGVWEIQPGGSDWQARAIAAAAAHPLGVGDARYRFSDKAQLTDTVPFGAFQRELVDQVGWYDESLLTNEDYELNTRIRQAGGRIWLNPAIRSVYYARPTLGALARQYWRYGFWKGRMLRRYPNTLRWRQALPPMFVLVLLGSALLSIWSPLAKTLFLGIITLYLVTLLAVGFQVAVAKRDVGMILGIPLAIGCIRCGSFPLVKGRCPYLECLADHPT